MSQGKTKEKGVILIADDEIEVINLVQMVLEETEGYAVSSAVNGQDALAQIRKEQPDLVLLDMHMPKMNGLDVLTHLQDDPATARIPVIMLSVATTYPDVQKALQRGAVAYLPKPFGVRELSRQVVRILAMDESQRQAYRQQALKSLGAPW